MNAFALLIIGAAIGFLAWCAILGIERLESARCGWRWSESGYENRFVGGVGCMVKVDGRWFPENAITLFSTSSAAK